MKTPAKFFHLYAADTNRVQVRRQAWRILARTQHDMPRNFADALASEMKEHGIDLNADLLEGTPSLPLHAALVAGLTNVARALVAAGADPDAKNKFGQSARMFRHWPEVESGIAA